MGTQGVKQQKTTKTTKNNKKQPNLTSRTLGESRSAKNQTISSRPLKFQISSVDLKKSRRASEMARQKIEMDAVWSILVRLTRY